MTSVRDAVNRRITRLPPDASATDADRLLSGESGHYLLIVERGEVTGVVCTCDLGNAGRDVPVSRSMSSPVLGICEGASLQEAASLMREHGVGCLPVFSDNGRLLGIITRSELRRAGLPQEAVSRGSLCAACRSDEHVRPQGEPGDLGFCRECLDRARAPALDEELGAGG